MFPGIERPQSHITWQCFLPMIPIYYADTFLPKRTMSQVFFVEVKPVQLQHTKGRGKTDSIEIIFISKVLNSLCASRKTY